MKDVKEQRDQLYRKLDLLKAQGIEILGPNMSVLKTEPPPQPIQPQGEVLFYSEVSEAAASAGASRAPTISPHTSNVIGGPQQLIPTSGSIRKSSSMQASMGSLSSERGKKDSVANLHLMSTTNEAKGEKPEIRQQIPMKLSVSGGSTKERSGKKISSVVGLNKVSTLHHTFFSARKE